MIITAGSLHEYLTGKGASLVGFADLSGLPGSARRYLPRGVSIGVALDPGAVRGIADGPTEDYNAEYLRVNAHLERLSTDVAVQLTNAGYESYPIPPTIKVFDSGGLHTMSTPLPHKTTATRAGLGWIGRNVLLVTREYGSAVRFASVLTNAPFETAAPVDESQCGTCRACVDACPAEALQGPAWYMGCNRDDMYDPGRCLEKLREYRMAGGWEHTICGVCLAACPWTKQYTGGAGTEDD